MAKKKPQKKGGKSGEGKFAIKACPNCGGREFAWVGGNGRAIFDFTGVSSLSGLSNCKKCGRDVFPIEFDSEKSYRMFLKNLRERPAGEKLEAKQEAPESGGGIRIASGWVRLTFGLLTLFGFFALLYIVLVSGFAIFSLENLGPFLFLAGLACLFLYFYLRASEK
ncbi:MAG: hypothetical protein AB1468_03550 [Candidatus Micrarchaeota archaeon]